MEMADVQQGRPPAIDRQGLRVQGYNRLNLRLALVPHLATPVMLVLSTELMMLRKFKEIWFGVLFGVGAVVIDAAMHAQMSRHSFLDELAAPSVEMIFYRVIFLAFGCVLGWLLWRNSRQEREVRWHKEVFQRFRSDLRPLLVMSYSRLELILTRPESASFSREVIDILQTLHEDIRRMKSAVEEEKQGPHSEG